jgi:hypothetical protein
MRIDIEVGLSDRNGVHFGNKDPRYLNFLKKLGFASGGFKRTDAKGYFLNEKETLIEENSVTISIFLDDEKKLDDIKKIIIEFLEQTNQESAIIVKDFLKSELVKV